MSKEQRIAKFLKKYKYAALVLLLGMGLLLIPTGKKQEPAVEPVSETTDEDYVAKMEERLSAMLSQIEGAGEVQVLLSLKNGSRTEYQSDTERSESSEQRKTVILSAGSAYDEAAVSTVYYPQFQGALIVSQGADRATVKYDLINAVASVTGLKADLITVVKMK